MFHKEGHGENPIPSFSISAKKRTESREGKVPDWCSIGDRVRNTAQLGKFPKCLCVGAVELHMCLGLQSLQRKGRDNIDIHIIWNY